MKPVLFVVLLTGCAAEMPCGEGTMCGRVVEGQDARLSKEDAVSLDVTVFWRHDDIYARVQYAPMVAASVAGDVPVDFAGALPDAPPDDGMIEIENPETGVADPGAGVIGVAQVYLTAPGAVDDDPEGVNALDLDLVLGMARGVTLFYTPVDLDTTAGIRGFPEIDDSPISAGYHLFIGEVEEDLTTPIETELGYVAT